MYLSKMMKKLMKIILLFLIIYGCESVPEISVSNGKTILNDEKYFFLDVRTLKEHEEKAIPNTICIPVQELSGRISELENQKGKKIVVYCRSGNRSSVATKILNENGFDAFNLVGGMNDWEEY
tara:strand:- start:625 stop:993 length:369 start_codon:yes stop_codon:yes gene_type:complete